MYELQKVCFKLHFSKRILVTLLAYPVLWRAGSLYVVICRELTACEFAGRSSFAIKFANPSDTTMSAWSLCCLFLIKAFQALLVIYLHTPYRCAKNFDIVELKWPFCLVKLSRIYTYSFFGRILTQFLKKNVHPHLGLSSKVFTQLDHLFTHRSDFSNSLAISLTEWPEDRKNRYLGCFTNSVGIQF